MPFTNLNKRLDNAKMYSKRGGSLYSKPKKRDNGKVLKRIILILVILFVAVYLPIRGVYGSTKKVIAAAKGASEGLKQENLDTIRVNLKEMKSANGQLNLSLNFLFWARIIPYFGGFYADAVHFSKAADFELKAVNTLADSLDPYKQELGFKGSPTPGQDRISQAVKVLDKVIPQLDKVQPDLKSASEEVKSIDVNKYPEKFGNRNVRSLVDTAKNFIQGGYYAVSEARPAIEVAPSALGEGAAKNYLIIFQNDKEIRATGGFMTAYATMKLDKGHLTSSQSDDIYRLDENLLKVCQNRVCPLTPPPAIATYLPEADGRPRTTWSMRDSNLSPDLPTSLKTFERMYSLLGQGTPWDGIIMIDTHVVEELIKITGPIEVFGTTYSAETDKRCNCPNVIYELERYAQVIEKGEADRKAVLGTLMQQILARSLGASTEKMPEFINAGIKLAASKHAMFYMDDPKTQAALSKLNWTGEIKQFSGDYLHVNDSNFAGGKSNLYVYQDVLLEIDTKSVDKIKHKLTITYKNDQAFNSWLNGINRDYVRAYVPKGSNLTGSKGSDVKVTTLADDLGKTAFEAFIQVRPQNSRQLIYEYETPGGFSGKEYPLMIQKQSGTKDFHYTVKVNGVKKADFKLDGDKELKLGI